MTIKISKYLGVWWVSSRTAFSTALSNRAGAVLFLAGKILRFLFFFLFLFILSQRTQALAGYTTTQVIFFFLTFNLVDVVSQMLFREVYWFRAQIVTGGFDLVLSRPVNPLFRALLGRIDILDLLTLPPLLILVVAVGANLHPSSLSLVAYLVLLGNALLFATAFHIAVLALGVVTTAIDHTMWIYRDLTAMARVPIDFYKEPIRGLLTFAIPVGLMMTVPAKTLMGILEWPIIVYSFLFSIVAFRLSLFFWHWALKNYSSASS
ncbi:ABC-2 family transporter protein [Candidatus Microgenomates bacterium]|nr:ABC-2 family transporter protein [Candidatus Microgenomates bacterium]